MLLDGVAIPAGPIVGRPAESRMHHTTDAWDALGVMAGPPVVELSLTFLLTVSRATTKYIVVSIRNGGGAAGRLGRAKKSRVKTTFDPTSKGKSGKAGVSRSARITWTH